MTYGNLPVARITKECDLSVLFTYNLRFGSHINKVFRTAKRLVGLIIKYSST